MDKNEVIAHLNGIDGDGTEDAHIDADLLLLQFLEDNGYKGVAEAWRRADNRTGGFWYV